MKDRGFWKGKMAGFFVIHSRNRLELAMYMPKDRFRAKEKKYFSFFCLLFIACLILSCLVMLVITSVSAVRLWL